MHGCQWMSPPPHLAWGAVASPRAAPRAGASMHRAACRAAWHPQGPIHPSPSPVPLHFQGTPPHARRWRSAWRTEARAVRHVVARGGGAGRWGPCGCQAWDHPKTVGERNLALGNAFVYSRGDPLRSPWRVGAIRNRHLEMKEEKG